ncbi:unnamed protein product [Auanema sp. JU1783]|nr:unnamed protein product [Auanema sp. JU1783]
MRYEDFQEAVMPFPSRTDLASKARVLKWLNMPPTLLDRARVPNFITPSSSTCSINDSELEANVSEANSSLCLPLKKGSGYEFITFYPDCLKHIDKTVEEGKQEHYTQIGQKYNMVFKMSRSNTKLVKTVFHSYGFTQCSWRNGNFNVIWAGSHLKAYKMRNLQPWQRVNQFPRSSELTRKDKLYENIARSQTVYGDCYEFIPEFYVTPRDCLRMNKAFEERSKNDGDESRFIVKPVSSSRGQGIFFITEPEQVPLGNPLLVSEYISNPLVVNDHKFDLRIYTAVTCFNPLVVYIYAEGLTRLASAKYSTDASFTDEFVHLTNYSINKNSQAFIRNESMSTEDFGHKWTLGALLRHLELKGIDSKLMMLRIEDIVIKSLLSVQGTVNSVCKTTVHNVGTNFELFGFDILVDSNLKPWLLEVNLSPSLSCDAPLDSLVKTRLICDLFNLACIPLYNKRSASTNGDDSGAEEEKEIASNPRLFNDCKRKSPPVVRNVAGKKLLCPTSPMRTEMKFQQILKKFRFENERKGDFVRIFPRKNTFELYKPIMEFSSSEKFDRRIYEEEFGINENLEDLSETFHEVMILASKYPSFKEVPKELKPVIDSWYNIASVYCDKITKEGEIYAAKLPVVRATARLRTKSCSDWYEVRKNTLEIAKAKLIAETQGNEKDEEKSENGKENNPPNVENVKN